MSPKRHDGSLIRQILELPLVVAMAQGGWN